MFLSYRDGLSFHRRNHKYLMRDGLVEGLTEESLGAGGRGEVFSALAATSRVAGVEGGTASLRDSVSPPVKEKNHGTPARGCALKIQGHAAVDCCLGAWCCTCKRARGGSSGGKGPAVPGGTAGCQAGARPLPAQHV